jgi:filamentous hemagglutinin
VGYPFYLGVLITKGFNPSDLADHFKKHVTLRNEFSAATMYDYQSLADQFMSAPRSPTVHECVRAGGDIVRYDSSTEEFGILDKDGVIRSYFKPDPARHGEATNLDYWKKECKRIF